MAGGRGVHLGLAKGNRGLPDLLGYLFALGSTSETGECESFALGAVSSVIGLAVCSRSWLAAGWFVVRNRGWVSGYGFGCHVTV